MVRFENWMGYLGEGLGISEIKGGGKVWDWKEELKEMMDTP